MRDLSGKHILITQSQLARLAGSEMVTLELTEHFASKGAHVIIVTHALAEPMNSLLLETGKVEIFLSDDPSLEARLKDTDLALAWVHHLLIPEGILRGELDCPVVFNHMSAAVPIEFPIMTTIEQRIATAVLFNSPETLARQAASGLLGGFDPARLRVFPNPAPDEFIDAFTVTPTSRPRLLVVSNHLPVEVTEALDLLSPHFDVSIVGKANGIARVRAETLRQVDAVLSIGKTVQYALVAGLPTYCYDHFGGPGWLSPSNFDLARQRNFSGRGFDVKTPVEIATELVDGLSTARDDAHGLRSTALSEFVLSVQITNLLDFIEQAPLERIRIDEIAVVDHLKLQELVGRFVRDWVRDAERGAKLEDRLAAERSAHEELRERFDELRLRHEAVHESKRGLESHASALEESRGRALSRISQLDARLAAEPSKVAELEQRRLSETAELQTLLDQQTERAAALQAELDSIARSASWQITRPLRAIAAQKHSKEV